MVVLSSIRDPCAFTLANHLPCLPRFCTTVQVLTRFGLVPRPLRAPGQYAGLKNGGATCYMNAVFQQLFMQPGIRAGILGSAEVRVAPILGGCS